MLAATDKGAVGVVHIVENIGEAQWLVYNASAGPYMAIVSTSLFQDIIELFMENAQNVAGVLMFNNASDR